MSTRPICCVCVVVVAACGRLDFDDTVVPGERSSEIAVGHFIRPDDSRLRYACAIDGGVATCWGNNEHGQLGNGTATGTSVPVRVALGRVTRIAAGGGHTCAIDDAASLWCWGWNGLGQLGDGTYANDRSVPVRIMGLDQVADVTLGFDHSCALRLDGTVWCWGANSEGQVGASMAQQHYDVPVQVQGLAGCAAVKTQFETTCALQLDGTVWCWGRNDNGQRGSGPIIASAVPAQVPGIAGATSLAMSTYFGCALGPSSIQCWGANSYNEHLVATIPDAVAIAGTNNNACAVTATGDLYCIGSNVDAILGLGDVATRATLVQVGLANVTSIDLVEHACARTSDGAAWCWGDNTDGALGDGTTVTSMVPVRVKL